MKDYAGGAAIMLAWFGVMFFLQWAGDPGCRLTKPGPCETADTLQQDIEKKFRDGRIEALEEKKDALDEQIYRLQVSPEQYQHYREKVQADERMMADTIAKIEAEEQKKLVQEQDQLSKAQMDCKQAHP